MLNKKVIFNTILDFRKEDIDCFERCELIRSYLIEEDISISELARRIGVSSSTVDSWLVYDKINKTDYNKLIRSGYSKTQIFKALKESDKNSNIRDKLSLDMDNDIRNITYKLEKYISKKSLTKYSLILINDLENVVSRLKRRIDKQIRNEITEDNNIDD